MNDARSWGSRLHLAVGLLSSSLIALQLVLMQVLSVVQWYHFAYMIISVALLGFGASGTLLAIAREWFLARFDTLVSVLMLACGASMAGVVALSQTPSARFDSYLLFVDLSQLGALVLTYLLFFIPFFLGALAIGLVFVHRTEQIGSYYFANLLGSGLGGIGAIALLWLAIPERLPAVTALLPTIAGVLVLPRRHRFLLSSLAAGTLALALYFVMRPPDLTHSQYKALSRTMDLPNAEIVLERSSPYGLVHVVSSPALRHAPGLSLTYPHDLPVQQGVFNNGNWFGAVTAWTRDDTTHLLNYTTAALPYAMQRRDSVLVLDAGTGEAVAQAMTQQAHRIAAVEPHQTVIGLLQHELAAPTDSLFAHPAVSVDVREPRTHLAADASTYDLIVLPHVGAFGGTLGLSALEEQYLLTLESFRAMWNRLAPDGAISITAWVDFPYRHPLKILATFAEVLDHVGVETPTEHIAAVRSWGTITFVLKRTAFTDRDVQNIRRFCERMAFDPALLPHLEPGERTRHNQMQDDRFFAYLDRILSPERTAFYQTYPFELRPATDNRPYFSQFLRWQSLPQLMDHFGQQTFPFLALGYLIVGVTLIQIVVLALVLIILPLVRIGWRGRGKGWTLLYFGGLGLGYLFVEMVLIQRFTLYFGHPIFAAAAVLAMLMIGSGVGSYLSTSLSPHPRTLQRAAGGITVALLLYALLLMPLLRATIALPLGVKGGIAAVLIALPAIVMGLPFPLGLRLLHRRSEPQVPWAWGINGCLSVVSTPLAAVLAVEGGFVLVMVLAAAAYGLVVLATRLVAPRATTLAQ